MFENISYEKLSHLSVGRIAEYWIKLTLTLHGLDVYTTEVDDKGIDFVVRTPNGNYFDMQVKSVRYPSTKYVFISKAGEWQDDKLRSNLFLALVIIKANQEPMFYLIPSTAWKEENLLLKNRTYGEEYKSKPEWGVNISNKNWKLLEEFEVHRQVSNII